MWKHKNYVYLPTGSGDTAKGLKLMDQSGVRFSRFATEATWRTDFNGLLCTYKKNNIVSADFKDYKENDSSVGYGTRGDKVKMIRERKGNFINTEIQQENRFNQGTRCVFQ